MIEFRNCIIYSKSYTIQSSGGGLNSLYHIKSWDIKGSIDGKRWDIIDSHFDSQEMNLGSATKNFKLKEGLYRYFKLEQTQKGFTGVYGFSIRQLEIFGMVFESDYVPNKHCECFNDCKSNKQIDMLIIFILMR